MNNLSAIQKSLLETFKSFDGFCKEHDIRYYAAFGTLLGAIRHKGFIPWDDDMDVFMHRSEYVKFASLKQECALNSKFRIADFKDKGYPYNFAKFYDCTKTFWEYKHFPFVMGPFIDVFILDDWDGSPEMIAHNKRLNYLWWKYRKSIAWHPWEEILYDIKSFNFTQVFIKLVKKCVFSPLKTRYFNQLVKEENLKCVNKGTELRCLGATFSITYEREDFREVSYVPFEDTLIPVPVGYDNILTIDYGDYMTPPPSPERSGHHLAFFMNLEHRYEVEDILKLKGKELNTQRPSMPLKTLFDEIRHRKGFK